MERPGEQSRSRLKKSISDSQVAEAFRLLQEAGIRAGAHFIVGFENDGPGVVPACFKTAKALRAAYCAINIYQQRLGAEPLAGAGGPRKELLRWQAGFAMARYNLGKQLQSNH